MRLDCAREDLQLEVSVTVNRKDPGDLRVGVVVADNEMTADGGFEASADIDLANPKTAVVRHVHEVDGDVIAVCHGEGLRSAPTGYRPGSRPGLGIGASKQRSSRLSVKSLRSGNTSVKCGRSVDGDPEHRIEPERALSGAPNALRAHQPAAQNDDRGIRRLL